VLISLYITRVKQTRSLWYANRLSGAAVMLRMPSRVVFPFGYRISVRQLSDADMNRRDANADGIWDDATKTIYLRKRLPVTRRRYILAHELGHAWLDWQHRHLDNGKAKT
jgi:IrrE N-terminal-like domain